MSLGALRRGLTTIRTLSDVEETPHANLFPDAEPKTIRLSLAAGDRVPTHRHPDRRIVLHLFEGTIELTLGDIVHELEAGDVVHFDGDQEVSPQAVTDATALLVLAPRSGSES